MNLAVGFFDGVHLGHQRILAQADAALTFSNHPATVFAPARAPRLLMTCADRLAAISVALHDAQSDSIRALDFTPAFAAQPPVAFADWLRVEYPALDTLYCGENWTFGAGGMGNADFLRARGFRGDVTMQADRLDKLVADAVERREGADRILEDDADPAAADPAQLPDGHLQHVLSVEEDASLGPAGGRGRQEPGDGHRHRALAAAGFTDESEHLAAVQRQVDVLRRDGVRALLVPERNVQILYLQ